MPLGDFSGRHDAPKEDDIDGARDPPIAADRNRDRADVGIWRSYGASGGDMAPSSFDRSERCPMTQVNDLSRSRVWFGQNSSVTVVAEMSASSWLVAGQVPGLDREPLKKLEPDPAALLPLVERWRDEAVKAGRTIKRVELAFGAGRDGFWLARWLRACDIEVHVIHSTSVAVSREHRRAKTDRLETAMLTRVFLGGLRGERGHCGIVVIPTLEEEDARRPSRERESLVVERTRIINGIKAILAWLGIRSFNPKLRKAVERLTRCGHRTVYRCHRTRLTNSGPIWLDPP